MDFRGCALTLVHRHKAGNDGAAPFYKDWPVWLYVTDEAGNVIEEKEIPVTLSSVLPGETIKAETYLDTRNILDLAGKQYHVSIGILDPMTGKASLRLAMTGTYEDGKNILW